MTQNPREVATKFGKSMHTFFAKGFPEAEAARCAWLEHLEDEALYGPDDPIFLAPDIAPRAKIGFKVEGFTRSTWKSTEPARKIVNGAFIAAILPAFGPHSFRHMLARHAAKNCRSVATKCAGKSLASRRMMSLGD